MPIYEYECTRCGEKFEEFCRLNDDKKTGAEITCPKCGSNLVERVYSTFGMGSSSCGSAPKTSSFG